MGDIPDEKAPALRLSGTKRAQGRIMRARQRPESKMKTNYPKLPIDTFIQEASNLLGWLQPDLKKFQSRGIIKSIEKMPGLIDRLVKSQSAWVNARKSPSVADKKDKIKAAKAIRSDIIAYYRFIFRNNRSNLNKLPAIRDRSKPGEIIQDLYNLSELSAITRSELNALTFDFNTIRQAQQAAAALSQTLSRCINSKERKKALRKSRDTVFLELKEIVNAVRFYGRFMFRNAPERRFGYTSQYNRALKQKRKKKNGLEK